MSMATKLGRMVTYLECLPPIKVLIPLVTWSCKISWQTKTIIYPLPQCLWPPNLPVWWLTLRGSYHIVTRPLIRLLDHVIIWKILFLHFYKTCGHKIWQGADFGKRFSTQTIKSSPTFCYFSYTKPREYCRAVFYQSKMIYWLKRYCSFREQDWGQNIFQ